MRIIFVHEGNKNNVFIQQFLLFCIRHWHVFTSGEWHKQLLSAFWLIGNDTFCVYMIYKFTHTHVHIYIDHKEKHSTSILLLLLLPQATGNIAWVKLIYYYYHLMYLRGGRWVKCFKALKHKTYKNLST